MKDGLYWLNTPWACGGVIVKHGRIVNACPIYKKMVGWKAEAMKRHAHVWVAE